MLRTLRLLFSTLLITALTVSVASTAALAAEKKKPVKQDPALAITLQEVEALVAKGTEEGNYQLIDARPEIKFNAGHIPTSINIPKPLLPQNLDTLAKDKMLIFYCGGTACKLSPQSAEIAMQNGFTSVKVFYEGMPAWIKGGNYKIVELDYVKKKVMEGGQEPFLLIDARPLLKYQKAFIPGAMSLPEAEFDLKKGMLPADKSTPLAFYCGGYKCNLSHKSAKSALALGYTDVAAFSAGEPVWRDAGLPLWGNESSGVIAKAKKEGLPETITAEEFTRLAANGTIQIVDVRDPEDYAKGHIPGSINVFDEDFIFKQQEAIAKLATDRRIVLVCTTGARSGSSYYAILDAPDFPNKGQVQYLDAEVSYMADGSFVFAQK
ncbi:MAG: sulfurtransferase [Desulfuromonas sp.]|jgi:rhodanese-related sulfurtransferase|nr:MAG: sulfurtransferase [Desulfuromonas sp.]